MLIASMIDGCVEKALDPYGGWDHLSSLLFAFLSRSRLSQLFIHPCLE